MKYMILYWLPNQSKIFSSPQLFITDDITKYLEALQIADKNGYELETYGPVSIDNGVIKPITE